VTSESEPSPTECEIDGSQICRPQLFLRSDVAGVAVPTTVLSDGIPIGRWLLCLESADGNREVVPLPEWIDLPGGGRLWFDPLPDPPKPGVSPRWSAAGRNSWLQGETPDGARLFHDLCTQIGRFVVFPEEDAAGELATAALWIMLTYCYPAWPAVPYLRIAGTLASGKSRLLEVLSRLVLDPTLASSMTAGVLFRTLHAQGGTFLLDEAERLQDKAVSSELRTVLLAGYKSGARVSRLKKEGSGFRSVHFDVFGPKAFGGIVDLPATLASRCIRLNLLRSADDRPQVRARLDAHPSEWQDLRDGLYAFALSHASEIVRTANRADGLTDGMSGRDAELWQPLLTLAYLCGREGTEGLAGLVCAFADVTIADSQEDTAPDPEQTLLAHLAARVTSHQADVMPKDLLARAKRRPRHVCQMDTAPCRECPETVRPENAQDDRGAKVIPMGRHHRDSSCRQAVRTMHPSGKRLHRHQCHSLAS